MNMNKIKVFLSDPQVLFREGIHFILSGEEEFEVTGETTSNEEAFTLIEANTPHVAILSLQSAKLNGPEVTRRIKRSQPAVSVILTMDREDELPLYAALKAGASACITKDTDPEVLLEIIRLVSQGRRPIIEAMLMPGIAAKILADFEETASLNEQVEHLLADLSGKEADILKGIAAGDNMDQLMEKQQMTEEAIRNNLKLALNKLVSNDQAQALIEAAQRSLPAMMRNAPKGANHAQYVTKEEFNEFKDSLMERLKSFIGELA